MTQTIYWNGINVNPLQHPHIKRPQRGTNYIDEPGMRVSSGGKRSKPQLPKRSKHGETTLGPASSVFDHRRHSTHPSIGWVGCATATTGSGPRERERTFRIFPRVLSRKNKKPRRRTRSAILSQIGQRNKTERGALLLCTVKRYAKSR